jgi:hypothetical protein
MSYNAGKNWKKKQVKNMLNKLGNYTDLGNGVSFFTNPNPSGGVKATEKLNELSKYCEETFPNYKDKDVDARFEMNPMTFAWEYTIDMFKSRMVMSERKDGDIDVWMYFGNPDKMFADHEETLEFRNVELLALTVEAFMQGATANRVGQKFNLKTA